MKSIVMAGALALASIFGSSQLAAAADLPTKAPAPKAAAIFGTTYPYSGAGLWFGVYTAGASTSVEATGLPGVNTAGLNTFGGSVGGSVGYSWASADQSRFARVFADIGWQNLNGASSGFSVNGPVSIQAGADVGVPFDKILQFFPTFNLPSIPTLPLPAGVTAGTAHGYGGLFADINDVSLNFGAGRNEIWSFAPGLRIGTLVPLSNGLALDGRIEYTWNNSGGCLGGPCATMGNTVRAKVGVDF